MNDEPPSTEQLIDVALGELRVVGRDASGATPAVDLRAWCGLAIETLEAEDVTVGELDLVFVAPGEMAALNARHMGHEGPTDVLAFPMDAGEPIPDDVDESPPRHLGDVVICPELAMAQAAGHTGSASAELALLVIHGVLHVLGHDHADETGAAAMQARERHHLLRLGHLHPVAR